MIFLANTALDLKAVAKHVMKGNTHYLHAVSLSVCLALLSGCVNLNQLEQKLLEAKQAPSSGRHYQLNRDEAEFHFAAGDTQGTFRVASADLTITNPPQLDNVSLAVQLATGSISLANPLLEQMLRGGDWFASSQYPLAEFVSREITSVNDTLQDLAISGVLTIKDVSQPITLSVQLKQPLNLHQLPPKIEFTANGAFDRTTFGMTRLLDFAPATIKLAISGYFEQQAMIEKEATDMTKPFDSSPHIEKQ